MKKKLNLLKRKFDSPKKKCSSLSEYIYICI